MSSIASYRLTSEERDELKEAVFYDIQTILGLAELIEKSLDSLHRLDVTNLGGVESLSLKLANLSRYSENAQKKIEDFMTDLEEGWNKEEGKFKIRYEDTMTSYLLDETFDSEEEAYQFIDENFFEGDLQFYEVEVSQ
tara:strand:- start:365 stop:778 length:414 start_codon:yes stop_codon:yes gene_type:complete